MQQLSAQDAQFLYMETNKSLSQVTAVSIFDPSTAPGGVVRFKQIIDHVQSRLHTSPIYKRRLYHVPLELDYPYWIEDEHFDIEYHIRHGRLPVPADWRQLCIHLARFHSRPLDMQRAPWEMYVIEGLDNVEGIPKGCYAVATKIHHAAADGMAIINFFGGLHDLDAEGTPVMPAAQKVTSARYEKPTPFQMSARGMINTARSPMKIADTLLRNAPAIVRSARDTFQNSRSEAKQTVPITRFNLETSPHRMFDATTFPLQDFKQIRRLVENSTINDVVLAVCSGALRKYLAHHKELPAETLRAFVPVNVRPTKGSLTESDQPGNNISTMAPSLYTNIEDPVERFAAIYNETRKQKAAKKGISARLMTDVTRHIPASTQLLAARLVMSSEMAGRMTNVCISNVPGPDVPIYMNGAKGIAALGLGPLGDRMGLFIAVTSYNGVMYLNATSCRRTMPDIEFFISCMRESFTELNEAALALPKQAPASKKPGSTKKAPKKTTKKVSGKASSKKKTGKVAKLPANRKKRSKKT
ncbi:MAG: wax ester/triacylglycerol synthase family O-acyltransferase [Pseudomonadota bacterium]